MNRKTLKIFIFTMGLIGFGLAIVPFYKSLGIPDYIKE
jgi:cytochrome c oxidase assembly protein Cox11